MPIYERRGGEFLANSTTADHQDWAQITYLVDGRFVIVWRDRGPSDTSGHSVRGQIFNADGSTHGTEFLVNTTVTGAQTQPALFALPTGGFVVAWTDNSLVGDPNIKAQVFDSTGAKSGGEISVNTSTSGAQTDPAGAVLADGSFVLTWHDSTAEPVVSGTGGSPIGVRSRHFDATGAPLGDETAVNTTTLYEQSYARVSALPGGGYVVVWQDMGNRSGIVGQIFAADGTKTGPEFLVSTTVASTQQGAAVATLEGGGFVVTWTDHSQIGGDTSYSGIKAQIFDSAGARVGGEFLVNTVTSGIQTSSFVTALPGGGFVVVWSGTTSGDSSGSGARAQYFDATGTKVGAEFLVNAVTAGDQFAGGVAVGADALTYVWVDLSGIGGDASGAGVKFARFIVAPGTEGADTLAGTAAEDEIHGFGGDDVIDGLDGSDLLDGGDGDDIVSGAGGNDRLEGGAGADELDGGSGVDLLEGGSGDDALDGGGEADLLLGGDGGDVVNGGEGDDDLDGEAGSDRLDGGAGDDYLYATALAADGELDELHGGAGSDTLLLTFAAAGAAVTYTVSVNPAGGYDGSFSSGGELRFVFTGIEQFRIAGTDSADSFAGGEIDDILLGWGGDDVLSGGGGADLLVGGAGADSMTGGSGNDRYVVDNAGDTVVEEENGGLDEVQTNLAAYTLTANVEVLRGQLAAGQLLTGNGLANTLFGNSGADTLDGGAGADRMVGGGGNDVYIVDDAADAIEDSSGTDEIRTSLNSFTLGSFGTIENLTGTLGTGQSLTGNTLANVLRAGDGNDELNGGAAADQLFGGGGDDELDGGEGADALYGGAGDDIYYLDNQSDVVVEQAGEGIDELRITQAGRYVLSSHVENATAQDSAWHILEGNALDNVLRGGGGSDTLDGKGGVDIMIGGQGPDTYHIDSVGDVIVEEEDSWSNPIGDTVVTSLAEYTLRADLENLEGNTSQQRLVGNDTNNFIRSGGGSDTLIGGKGDDAYSIYEGDTIVELDNEGTDTVYVNGGNYTLADTLERLSGQSSVGQVLTGNRFANYISASSGNDTLDGAGGADTMEGGSGNDIYHVDDAGDVVIEGTNRGTDEVRTALPSYTLGANVENFTGTSATGQTVHGNTLSNTVAGGAGDDVFHLHHGGSDALRRGGTDIASGGAGNDSFLFGAGFTGADRVNGGSGTDLVALQGGYSSLTFGASALVDVETLALLSHTENGVGLGGATPYSYTLTTANGNVAAGRQLLVDAGSLAPGENLTFNGAAETDGSFLIRGGKGVDRLTGGAQADIFFFDEDGRFGASDEVKGGSGNDTLVLRGNYGLAFAAAALTSIETLTLISAADARYGAGGAAGSFTYGVTTVDANLELGARLTVDASGLGLGEKLTFDGSAESDGTLGVSGGAGDDWIIAGAGADLLNGGAGADWMTGGLGNDTFYVDDAGDVASESAGQGRDVVYASVNYTLGNGSSIEILSSASLAGTDPLHLAGNALDQEIYGNAGANVIRGGGGADLLFGLAGDDEYWVTDSRAVIFEGAGGGRDVVYTSVSLTLNAGAHVEVLSTVSVSSSDVIHLRGNELDQEVIGNHSANVLRGGGGSDALVGLGGNDEYYIESGAETIYEAAGGGRDVVYTTGTYALNGGAEIEVISALSLAGTEVLYLIGNEHGQEIYGNAGNNYLDGAAGADVLIGGGDADTFGFASALGNGNVDRIHDFEAGLDRIGLDDAVFAGVGSGSFEANAFRLGATAQDSDDRILYDQATGQLFYDADGNGASAAVLFAQLSAGTVLTAGDFAIL